MAEIIDTSSYRGKSSGQANAWIVMFNDDSTEQGRKAHIDLVKQLNAHVAGVHDGMHYPGIQHIYDHPPGYAGIFRPEVVQWIRTQGDIGSVEEDVEANTN